MDSRIESLESDRKTVEDTSIEDPEAEIDLTGAEREVIEDYLEVF